MSQVAVIIGASGGIGSALVDAVIATGRFDAVHGVCRGRCPNKPGAHSHIADLTDEASIERAARSTGQAGSVRLVIVATGILHGEAIEPEKSLKALDPAAMAKVFEINSIGPAIVAKHFVPLLPREGRSVFAVLSARVGSIGDNRLGGWYSYRASKAALNQFVRTLSIELGRIRPQAVALALHPGTVATELSRPFRPAAATAGRSAPADAAARLLAVIDSATTEQSGSILAYDGSRIPF